MISEILINRLNGPTRRIREKHTDSLGRIYIKSYDCVLDADVNALLAEHSAEIQARIEIQDAVEASESDNAVSTNKEATIEQVALAYLRKAYSLDDPYQAYLKFDKFNDYRVSKGWSISQVVEGLSSVGLTQEEWDNMLARYSYLSNAQRVTVMHDYETVRDGDIWSNG